MVKIKDLLEEKVKKIEETNSDYSNQIEKLQAALDVNMKNEYGLFRM